MGRWGQNLAGEQILCCLTNATFSLDAAAADAEEGGKLNYQWQLLADQEGVWEDITGATEDSYTETKITFGRTSGSPPNTVTSIYRLNPD